MDQDPLVQQDHKVQQVQEVIQVPQEAAVHKALLVQLVRVDLGVRRVLRVVQVWLVQLGVQVLLVYKVHKGTQALLAHKELQELLVQQGQEVQLGQQVQLVQQVLQAVLD